MSKVSNSIFGPQSKRYSSQQINQQHQQSFMSQASSNPSSYVYIPCPSHPDLFITNICKERECIEPLCPECITAHLEMHAKKGKTAKIENIQRVKKECLQFLQQVKGHIVKDLSDMKFADQQSYYQQQVENLKNSHQRITDLLDDYFEILERELRQKIKDLDQFKKNFSQIEQNLSQEVQSLDNLSQELQGNNYVRMVIQVLEQQEQLKMNNKISQLEEAVQSYQKQLPIIQNDNNVLETLREQLKKFCFISSKKNDLNYSNNSTYQDIRSAFLDSTSKKKPDLQQSFAPLEGCCEVQIKNHFEIQDPVILRLEEDTKKITIFNLREQTTENVLLNLSFRIPVNHRVFSTNLGQHLLIGGVYRDKNRFKSSEAVYEVNLNNLNLVAHSQMCVARAMHSVCQIGNFLYVVGGTSTNDENTALSACEKLDLETKEWSMISDCKVKSAGCVLTSYNDRYIMKIGGKVDIFTPSTVIERYDILEGQWNEMNYQYSNQGYLRLPFNSCGVCIGYNKLLVFGGSVHDVKTTDCSIMSIEGEKIRIDQGKSIPRALEFNNQIGIVQENSVWVFQEQDSKKMILFGNGSNWKEL